MMKDIFVGKLSDVHALNDDKSVSNGQIVAYRSGKHIEVQNMNANPNIKYSFDEVRSEFVITIPVNDGDFIVLQDRTGIADKRVIK